MASESERCVDELLLKQASIDELVAELDTNTTDVLINKARDVLTSTQLYVDNNRSIIPGYCLKKVIESLRKLEARTDGAKKTSLKFKFKSTPKVIGEITESVSTATVEKTERSKSPPILPVFFGFQDKKDQQLYLEAEEVECKDISLINLSKCSVTIKGLANTVYIRNLKDTSVNVCLACRAITITNCVNCEFKLICQQLRIDSSSACDFTIFTSARSMLESSSGLKFKCLELDNLEGILEGEVRKLLEKAKFNANQNNWKCIDDFDCLSTTASKNYSLI